MVSAREHSKKKITVMGKTMAYVEMGDGDPIVFQHAIRLTSYLWRNIMPHLGGPGPLHCARLSGHGRFGQARRSGPDRYTLLEHREYFDAALEQLGVVN